MTLLQSNTKSGGRLLVGLVGTLLLSIACTEKCGVGPRKNFDRVYLGRWAIRLGTDPDKQRQT